MKNLFEHLDDLKEELRDFGGVRFWLTCYSKMNEKIFDLAVLGAQVAAHLIEV
jgi:hypothetical protein